MHLSQPLTVWLFTFGVDLARYGIVAGGAFALFWVWGSERFRARRITDVEVPREKLWREIRWSLSTVLVFSAMGVLVEYGGRAGILRRYESVGDRGLLWFGISVLVLVLLQDTYFYWTHRAMHHPRIYRLVHRVHHQSSETSPFTAYAFSPVEALVHALFVPLAWLALPLHELAVFAFLGVMIVRNVLGHLSIELYPSGFTRSPFWGVHTTTTHHALHHKRQRSNFGLYFTFWDRLMGTEDPLYEDAFEQTVRTTLEERTGR